MKTAFRFEFVDEVNDTSKILAFNITPLTADAKTIVDNNLEEALYRESRGGGTLDQLEFEYGVHDACFNPGFTSYEVPEDKQLELMEKWAKHFQNRGFSTSLVYETTDDSI